MRDNTRLKLFDGDSLESNGCQRVRSERLEDGGELTWFTTPKGQTALLHEFPEPDGFDVYVDTGGNDVARAKRQIGLQEAPVPKLAVIVMVPHYWGKAATLAKAWQRVVRESGKSQKELKRGSYRVIVLPETDEQPARVDQMGTVHWANVEEMRYLVVDEK